MACSVAAALLFSCAQLAHQNFRKRVYLLSTEITAARPRLYSLSALRGTSLSPTTEGQRMYHPTLSSAVTRRIWGSPDAILLFFAGGAAEFAAIKAVDWLFFTVRLPGAPVKRFFETVRFAQGVFFADPASATDCVSADAPTLTFRL